MNTSSGPRAGDRPRSCNFLSFRINMLWLLPWPDRVKTLMAYLSMCPSLSGDRGVTP